MKVDLLFCSLNWNSCRVRRGFIITKDNSAYCYLSSIVYMEAAVSQLLDSQSEKIRIIAKSELPTEQIIALHEGMRKNINSLIKLHLILSIKFELLINSISTQNESDEIEPKYESDLEKQYCQQQKEEQSAPSNICKPTTYIFKGRAQGNISNKDDPFADGLAIFQAYASDSVNEKKELFLSYSVMKGTKMLVLLSAPQTADTQFILDSGYKTVRVESTGKIIIKERSKPEITDMGKYVFKVRFENANEPLNFEIEINSNLNKYLNHKSGQIKIQASNLSIDQVNSLI